MMLSLQFEGWVQIRLATDPDPCDEPRGISGWTFALAGEPDLDRVLRLQNPVAPRSHGPQVGVSVRSVTLDGTVAPNHPLVGATVDLLDNPKFEGRNGLIAEDALELIDPFNIRIAQRRFAFSRRDVLAVDSNGTEVPIFLADRAQIQRRQPITQGFDPEVAEAAGFQDPDSFFQKRRAMIVQDIERAKHTHDEIAIVALTKRLTEMDTEDTPTTARRVLTSFRMVFKFDINGPTSFSGDQRKLLGGTMETTSPWPISFWIGGWDCDALCAYMRGSLAVPFTKSNV